MICRNRSSSVVVGLPTNFTVPPCLTINCLISSSAASAEARGADVGLVADLQQAVDPAQLLQLALVEDGDPVADVLHVGQQVAAHDDRLALLLQVQDQVFHVPGADRVQAGGRLVQQDQLGIVDQGLGQADAAGHALGILFQLPPLGPREAHHLDQPPHPLAADFGRHVEQLPVEIERFFGVEEAVEVGFFRQVADPLVLGDLGGVFAEDQGLAARGEEQTPGAA